MQIHDLAQGSDAWHQFRLDHFGASEAAAMLGLSTKVTRDELLHAKHTGIAKEYSAWVQRHILDYGHEVEALARPIVERLIMEDLYPITASDGRLSASVDGMTLDESLAFEHKQWNQTLAASVRERILPDEYMPQCQQILLVTGAKLVLFVVSDGTEENIVMMEVYPDPEWFERIRAGWAQFERDLKAYVPVSHAEKPEAAPILQLPALAIQIRGEVLASNLPDFEHAAARFLAGINADLQSDEDFAQAEATVKFCDQVEKDLALTKKAVISQAATIDDVVRRIDLVCEEVRGKRLTLDRLVKSRKEEIKAGIIASARMAIADHVAALDAEIAPLRLVYPQPDFAGAVKNKRTLASLHNAVNTEIANAKIAIGTAAAEVFTKLARYREMAAGHEFLFSDLQQIIQKPIDDFRLLVETRIEGHKKAEAEKLEAERRRIQAEEQAKAVAKVAQAAPAPAPNPPERRQEAAVEQIRSRTEPLMLELLRRDLELILRKYQDIAGLDGVRREISAYLASHAVKEAAQA